MSKDFSLVQGVLFLADGYGNIVGTKNISSEVDGVSGAPLYRAATDAVIEGVLDDVATVAAVENQPAPARITAQRALHANLRNNGGTEVGTFLSPLQVKNRFDVETFGALVSLPRQSQVRANFSTSLSNNNLINTVTSTGTTSLTNATLTIASGTGVTASSRVQSTDSIVYSPGREIYCQFTVAFTTPTSANSDQRAGLFDDNNGVFVGYHGTTFGVTTRAATANTFASAFNGDLLDGGATSLFTRAGVPEAIDLTKKNIFRIRFGWLGAAPFYFEVMAPDGHWVTFHTLRIPNTTTVPAIQATNLPITFETVKASADATNIQILTTSWDAGIVDIPDADDSGFGSITSGSAPNDQVKFNTDAHGTLVANITGTWVATLIFEGNAGDGVWNAIPALTPQGKDASSLTANSVVVVSPAGYTEIRMRALAYTSGTVNVAWNLSRAQSSLILVAGNVPSGTTDTGSPIKVGGVYNLSQPTVLDGQRVDLQLDAHGRLLTSGSVIISSTPAFSLNLNNVISAGVTDYTSYTAVASVAIKQFYCGGSGIGRQTLYKYLPNNTSLLTGGDFESAGDVSGWVWTSAGTGSVAFSTAQHNTGSGAAAVTFSNSAGTNAQGIKLTYGTVNDFSGWRYITSEFFNVVSTGGAYTRTISIILTDSAANTRTYSVSGLSTAAPFNASNWIKITGEIENPSASSGTAFDSTSISTVELRMTDSANRTGTVYWDTVRLEAQLTSIVPIFHGQNTSFNLLIDPVVVLAINDQILVGQTNNDASRKQLVALVGGVSI